MAAPGLEPGVSIETTTINIAEMMVMGTTGKKPRTIIPAAALVTISLPPIEKIVTAVPGGGAGTVVWTTATARTASAVQRVLASAPHFVNGKALDFVFVHTDVTMVDPGSPVSGLAPAHRAGDATFIVMSSR